MQNYYCEHCGNIFDFGDAAVHIEWHPYGEGMAAERWHACPMCGNIDLTIVIM